MSKVWILISCLFLLSLFTPASILSYSIYMLIGVFVFSRYLNKKNESCFEISGDLTRGSGFPGEELLVRLKLRNKTRLPVFWLAIYQSFPAELGAIRAKSLVLLPSKGERTIEFSFFGVRRGVYHLPAIKLEYGQMLSLRENAFDFILDQKIVIYPQIAKVVGLDLIRRLPLGRQSVVFGLHDDPSRLRGCREYVPGDRPKMIHWPNVAKTGSLQTKEWETTLDADIGIFLNLREADYQLKTWSLLSEDGIELAASIAYHLAGERVGFFANGRIPNSEQQETTDLLPKKNNGRFSLPPRKGIGAEKEILTYLAGAQLSDALHFESLLQDARLLTYGSILIIITPQIRQTLINEVKKLRFMGYYPIIISPGRFTVEQHGYIEGELKMIKVPVFEGRKEGAGGRVFTLSLQN